MATIKKFFLTQDDLKNSSLWWMDSHDDSVHEAKKPESLPDEVRPQDLIIRAKFVAPCKKKFEGYLIGCQNIFAIGIFIKDKEFLFNKNLPDLSHKYFQEFARLCDLEKPEDMFPIHYESDLDYENAAVFSGKFDAFEKLKMGQER